MPKTAFQNLALIFFAVLMPVLLNSFDISWYCQLDIAILPYIIWFRPVVQGLDAEKILTIFN